MRNKIIPYHPKLKLLARKLRKQGILSEMTLWKYIKKRSLGIEFHRQVPIDNFIVDFYSHKIMLAIEVDGSSHDAEGALLKDEIRQNKLESLGINFIRFKSADVHSNIDQVIHELTDKINNLKNISLSLP